MIIDIFNIKITYLFIKLSETKDEWFLNRASFADQGYFLQDKISGAPLSLVGEAI